MSIWDVPIELTNTIYTYAYLALIIGAIMTTAATMSLFWSSAIRDKFADTQLQIAKTEAAKANERAGALESQTAGLQKQAAEADARAEASREEQARLAIDLEREKIERLKFQGQFAWRILQPNEIRLMYNVLAASPGNVNIAFFSGDPESTFLALQLERIFIAAHWKVSLSATSYGMAVFFGVWLPPSDAPGRDIVLQAFRAIGFEPPQLELPPANMAYATPPLDGPTIGVAPKPIPGADALGKVFEEIEKAKPPN